MAVNLLLQNNIIGNNLTKTTKCSIQLLPITLRGFLLLLYTDIFHILKTGNINHTKKRVTILYMDIHWDSLLTSEKKFNCNNKITNKHLPQPYSKVNNAILWPTPLICCSSSHVSGTLPLNWIYIWYAIHFILAACLLWTPRGFSN